MALIGSVVGIMFGILPSASLKLSLVNLFPTYVPHDIICLERKINLCFIGYMLCHLKVRNIIQNLNIIIFNVKSAI